MIFKIHYTIDGYEDFIAITGETIEDIKEQVEEIKEMLGLDPQKNNMWCDFRVLSSEQIN